ncbi:roadblock/LC7 domain-containing protein [Halostreptopolyspora alba]|uniref:Roadblock/LC7 domain-containing protein n=1 Tax=Halostreptopolyspora alba TaxID=2487137 RepID=A0A3N0ECN9_9ACTN|nr:roadblock/LC7 domain-containing protein [Nocardiopsaceae bacterium YIM 96095]
MSENAENFTWLVSNFVSEVSGVEHAIVVSSDGLPLAASEGFPREHAEQLSAIVSGLNSLVNGSAQLFGKGECDQLIIRMKGGHLFVMAISDGSCFAVLSSPEADTKVVGYQMTRLVEDAGHVLTPQVRSQLREAIGI